MTEIKAHILRLVDTNEYAETPFETRTIGLFSTREKADEARGLLLETARQVRTTYRDAQDQGHLNPFWNEGFAAAKEKFGYDRRFENQPASPKIEPPPLQPGEEATLANWANRWGPLMGDIQKQIDQRKQTDAEYTLFLQKETNRLWVEKIPGLGVIKERFGFELRNENQEHLTEDNLVIIVMDLDR